MESLASFYRPQEFEEVVSQISVVSILEQQVKTKTFQNVYLLCGPSGTGKTTIARILANKINNNQGFPIEIDAASHNGVENVRELVASASERAINSEYKIYIIDECHAISSQAWQSFLKCIEEPPKYTIFIFCTTDPQKIPATILNRCQRFNLTKIPQQKIIERLDYICRNEGFTNYKETIEYISKIANGGMRDAISLLDKVSGYSREFNINTTLDILGTFSYKTLFDITNDIIDGNEANLIECLDDIYNNGKDLTLFVDEYLKFTLDLFKFTIFNNFNIINIPASFKDDVEYTTNIENRQLYFSKLTDKILEIKNQIKNDTTVKTTLEVMFLSLCRGIQLC